MTANYQTVEVPVKGMDCAECAAHVQKAISGLPGVQTVEVFLSTEKAVVSLDHARVDLPAIRQAVESVGYSVPDTEQTTPTATGTDFNRAVLSLFGLVFGAVLLITVLGEGLGLFEAITKSIPWPVGLALVLISGFPIFRNVIRASLKRQVISHTLMTVGVIAALVVGEWVTSAIVVFFMRVGDYAERFTTERSRQALKHLTGLAPQTARIERDGQEIEIPVGQVRVGDVVIVRPGEKIPVDGEVTAGHATIGPLFEAVR